MTEKERLIITKYDLLYEQRMTRCESAIENLNKTCQDLKETTTEIKEELKEIRKDMKADFRWLLFTMGVMFAVMAHGFKWF